MNRSEDIQAAKQHIREIALQKRDAISFVDRLERSAIVCERIGELLRDKLPDILTDEVMSSPTSIPTPELPFMRPYNPPEEAKRWQSSGIGTEAASSNTDDQPLACNAGQEWMFEPQSTRPEDEKPVLALYSSMKSEVDLSELAHGAFAHEWRVCFPAMVRDHENPSDKRMEFFEVTWAQLKALIDSFLSHQLRVYTVEELESAGFPHILPDQITAIVVPLVAFDDQNRRLGYGGGNYDRYLPKLNKDTVIIGAAFDEQQVDAIPVDQHDLPLENIVHA